MADVPDKPLPPPDRVVHDSEFGQRSEIYNPAPIQASPMTDIMGSLGPSTGTPIQAAPSAEGGPSAPAEGE